MKSLERLIDFMQQQAASSKGLVSYASLEESLEAVKQDCDDLFYVIASLLDEHLKDSAAQGSPAWDAADKIMHRW